jgi:ribosomal protein S14
MILFYKKPKANTNRAKRLFYKRNEVKYIASQLLFDSRLSNSSRLSYTKLKLLAVRYIRLCCILTGRRKSVMVKFQLSRIKLRDVITEGRYPGIRLASW